ncbi:isoleucine--tRNA ligase, mitochondrial [Anoplophora glabripennis]|uniref:isoleucine--tRNA ligase, mitochondrial n=1 Tax=Anoplophora glabripennis TaxID=217634 RepID=UPI000873A3A1|nr:isoleucine--tRNA ligase, mitochondrial [Anoplophora glabripennis]
MMLKFIQQINNTGRVCYCTKNVSKNKIYSSTVLLPKTNFPLRLENKKLVERDEYIYKATEFENLYSWQRSHLYEPEFVLHDGPPYANGQPHMGHAINKILKDTILRYHILNGNKVHYVPGWDCHGLPIELKAVSNSSGMDAIEVRLKARNFASKTVKEQRAVFKSWGVIGDYKNAYMTFRPEYVKIQLRLFYKLYKKNLIYRDIKPIYWSSSARTALAEAELEYNESHKSPSAYVRFKVKDIPKLKTLKDKQVYAIIWTTTPWTLPSNQALCYNETLSYSLVKKPDPLDTDIYIIATDLLESVSSVLNCDFQLLNVLSGDLLAGATYTHPIYREKVLPFLNGPHATATKGTGLVHTAPAHGPDDFIVALNNRMSVVDMVNEEGCYRSEAGSELEGKYVLSEGTEKVLELIKPDLMNLGEITHSYPYDWRTKKPVIIKASRQWFIDTNAIKGRALELLEDVKIVPHDKSEKYKKNLMTQIQKRPYWCISRQRKWGVPIPVFYNKDTSEIIINEDTTDHLCNLLEQHGTDFWWKLDMKHLLPENLCSTPPELIEKGEDIMDIWFDSGISWAVALEGEKVADLYLEGVDQFTGWFQSSLLTSVALRDKAPYKTVYVHGFAVDENGVKMSKSLGNVVDPAEITGGKKGKKPYGVDTLRWWVACHANQASLAHVSPTALQSSAEEVQKIRSVLRFALGTLADYQQSENDGNNLLLIDKYMLHLLYQFHKQVTEAANEYQFHKVSHAVINLLTNEVSALYYMAIKDRLYCDGVDSTTRRAAQYTLTQIFEIVTRSIAPIVPHLAEEMYLHLPQREKTYFRSAHAIPASEWEDEGVNGLMRTILRIKRDVNKESGTGTAHVDVSLLFSKKFVGFMKVRGLRLLFNRRN